MTLKNDYKIFIFLRKKSKNQVIKSFNFHYNIPRACLLNRPPVPAMNLKSNRSGL